jgi:hypothetical protein
VPGRAEPSQVRAGVSEVRSYAGLLPASSTTVQQTPDSAIESPIRTGPGSSCRSTERRRPDPASVLSRTVPTAWTRPVNLAQL